MNSYRDQARLLRAVAHPVRLQILEALACQPGCVCELMLLTKRRQAYVSQQLIVLREAGLVRCERQGLYVRYQLAWPEVVQLLEAVHSVSARSRSRNVLG